MIKNADRRSRVKNEIVDVQGEKGKKYEGGKNDDGFWNFFCMRKNLNIFHGRGRPVSDKDNRKSGDDE